MRRFDPKAYDVGEIVGELLDGAGAVVFPRLFSEADIGEARALVHRHSDGEPPKVTHFQGEAEKDNRLHLQRRVWNLLGKGAVFSRMAEHPVVTDVLKAFLGSEFIMGSIAANRLLPGGPGQEPHIDYPYWDYHKRESFPARVNAAFPLNAQVTIVLDPFTAETGATAYVPGSQKELRYPVATDDFHGRAERMTGEPGDTVIFFGAVWHCAMPNESAQDRSAVLLQYLPKFVKPMEDMPAALDAAFLDAASPMIRQLLGFDYPYPEVLDQSDAKNTEGVA